MASFFKDIKLNKQISNRLLILDDNKKLISTDITYQDINTAISKTNNNELDIANLTTRFETEVSNLNNAINNEAELRASEINNLVNNMTNLTTDLNNKINQEITDRTNDINTLTTNLEELNLKVTNNYSNLDNRITEEVNTRTEAFNNLSTNIDNVDQRLTNNYNTLEENKLNKVTTANQIYGTDEEGNQTSYDKDSFGKVDTVNGLNSDINKNIQLDATKINVNDLVENKQTIKDKLDSLDTIDNQINVKAEAAVKSVIFDNTTFIMTFKDYNDNIIKTIDLPVESTVKSGRYDSVNKKLILILQSDDEIEIPVEDLVDVYTGVDGNKIKVTVNNDNSIKAEIKTGTIEKTDLTSDLQTELTGKINKSIYSGNELLYNTHLMNKETIITDFFTSTAAHPLYNGHISIEFYNINPNTGNSSTKILAIDSNSKITNPQNASNGIALDTDDNSCIYINAHMESAKFDPKTSGLTSVLISPAIRELKGLIDTNTSNISNNASNISTINTSIETMNTKIGTNETSISTINNQITQLQADIEAAGKVDTVNNISPDSNKNIQLDGSKINVDDSEITKTTIKDMLNTIITRLNNLEATTNLMAEKITNINGEIV